jgi:hypothetical protein
VQSCVHGSLIPIVQCTPGTPQEDQLRQKTSRLSRIMLHDVPLKCTICHAWLQPPTFRLYLTRAANALQCNATTTAKKRLYRWWPTGCLTPTLPETPPERKVPFCHANLPARAYLLLLILFHMSCYTDLPEHKQDFQSSVAHAPSPQKSHLVWLLF